MYFAIIVKIKEGEPMTAEEFAQEFINDLPETLEKYNDKSSLVFCKSILKEDPELKILRKELNKHNYDLIPCEDNGWKLIKNCVF